MVETFKNRYLRYLLTLFLLLGVSLCSVSVAYGADQGYGSFWYGPNEKTVEGVKYYKTGVVASNKYDAALYALGFSKSTVNGISNTKKNRLKSDSTFSSFANLFKTGKPDDDAIAVIPGVPTVGLYADNMLTTWYAASAMYGSSNCYWSVYSKSAADSAENAAYTIIKSGSESGGSGGSGGGGTDQPSGSDGSYTYFTVQKWNEDCTFDLSYVGFKTTAVAAALEYAQAHNQSILVRTSGNQSSINEQKVNIITVNKDDITWHVDTGRRKYVCSWNNAFSTYLVESTGTVSTWNGRPCLLVENESGRELNFPAVLDGSYPVNYRNWGDDGPSGGDDEPTEPPTDWPTEPTEPIVPPDPPDPVEPDPPTPWNPIPGIDIDITGDDFQDLLDALNEHCIHLQNSINNNVSQLWELQSELFTNQLGTFWDNLHNDLLWLGECLNFDVNVNVDAGGGDDGGGEGETTTVVPFDDSSVIYWLKQIWSKLGNGVSIQPVDPVTQSDDWWAWLLALMGNFVSMLLAFGSDRLGDVTTAVNSLTGKFPFCLPWDLAAMFSLLDATPVIPSFDLPCFALTSNGLSEVGQYHITLEAFDGVWEGIRWVERLGFVVMLIRNTDKLMSVMRRAVGR